MKKIIHLICAARPNFMKIAPLYHVLKFEQWCDIQIIHTGQHYDYKMSQAFFDDFELPKPHWHLGVGSGSHAEQVAQTMVAYEKLCLEKSKPDLVIVVGDVNATSACTIAAKKIHLKVAHLEAGLRSGDIAMPEEINRLLTDAICDYYWTPSTDADEHLLKEGVDSSKITRVGNIMIDTYCRMKHKIEASVVLEELQLQPQEYAVVTIHRPSNVDNLSHLQNILDVLGQIDLPLIFPVHPRTKKTLSETKVPNNITLIDPQNYISFMALVSNAQFVITDSGGIQEETTYLQIPCFTLRDSTERPITITQGSNQLVTVENLLETIKSPKEGTVPELWDGLTAERVKNEIKRII